MKLCKQLGFKYYGDKLMPPNLIGRQADFHFIYHSTNS